MNAIGLMSGTSMDGIDIAYVRTDGKKQLEHVASGSFAFDANDRSLIEAAINDAGQIGDRDERPRALAVAESMITERHVQIVDSFLAEHGLKPENVDVIGFHGQTVLHRPEKALTVQIGNGAELARRCGIDVVNDLRVDDMLQGGQGAPLAPVYHRALAARLAERPVAFVNIGGVSNVTWIGPNGDLLAFDTGPGNALMDDWAMRHLGEPVDHDGELARSGTMNEDVLHSYLSLPYFDLPVPKSLDRTDFSIAAADGLNAADGAATLAHFTAASVIRSHAWFSQSPDVWVICGGGRKNRFLMELLAWYAECPVVPAEAIGCDGDAIEAEAWAYLAVRSLKNLPLTYPSTTGTRQAVSGGTLYQALPDTKESDQ